MNSPLVSIIIPCYNYAHYLSETLNNVLAQQYKNWECIIINDGSTDNTEEVAQKFRNTDARFKYIYQTNKGLSAARNTGIQNANGKYIQFLDSDDLLHSEKLSIQVQALENQPEIDILYGNTIFFFNDNINEQYSNRKKQYIPKNKVRFPLRISGKGKMIINKLLIDNIMEVSNPLIRKTIVEKAGLFNESMKSYEDWQFWIQCSLHEACFLYNPVEGTETYIRCGHSSMMANKKKLTLHGIRIRRLLHPYLNFKQRLYNYYRLSKLYIRLYLNLF